MWAMPAEFHEIVDRARSLLADHAGAELTVIEGAHRGARRPLTQAPLSIGADLSDDLILFGDHLAPGHVEVSLIGSINPSLRIAARSEAVEVNGVGRVNAGFETTLPLPVRVRVGGAVIEAHSRLAFKPIGGRNILMSVGFVSAAIIAGAMLAFSAADIAGEAVASISNERTATTATAAVDSGQIKSLITQMGLEGLVKAESNSDGVMVISGRLEGERPALAWRRMLERLDSDPASRHIVNLVTVDAEAAKPPAIGSIWRDGRPRVMLTTGERVGLGEKTADGWTVTNIDLKGVTLTSPTGVTHIVAAQ